MSISSLKSAPFETKQDYFKRMCSDEFVSCTTFLPFTDAANLYRVNRKTAAQAPAARALVTNLDLTGKKISDTAIFFAISQHPRLTTLRLANLSLTSKGITNLGNALTGRPLKSLILEDCACLLDHPKQTRALIAQINTAALENLTISKYRSFLNAENTDRDYSKVHRPFMLECAGTLVSKLKNSPSLKVLDLSLLQMAPPNAQELVQSLPSTLEQFGPFPGGCTDDEMALAMKVISPQTIKKCDFTIDQMTANMLRELLDYLPFAQMEEVTIRQQRGDLNIDDLSLNELLQKISTSKHLKKLSIPLPAEQTKRLISKCPDSLQHLGPWKMNSQLIAAIAAKKFKHIQTCTLSFINVPAQEIKPILATLLLSTMVDIRLQLSLSTDASSLSYLFEQLKKNRNLKTLQLVNLDFGYLPKLLEALSSLELEMLIISGEAKKFTDKINIRQNTLAILKEKLPQWPQIKRVEVGDTDKVFFNPPITLFSLKEVQKSPRVAAISSIVSSLFHISFSY